jgi:benzylsuccinate CoA-transferase BbsF subunit
LVGVLGRPSWATDPVLATVAGRRAHEDELDGRLAAWTADRSADELFALLQPRVAAAPVRAPGELLEDPQLRHRGYFPVLEHTVMGAVPYNGMQAILSATPGRLRKAAPCVGEDTWAVLTELLGYDEDEAARLLADGAVEINVG